MHILIVGQITSGKSNLAKYFASMQDAVIVYDPLKSTGWPEHAIKFSDPEKFLEFIKTARDSYVYIDEAKTLADYDEKRFNEILYKRRHQGLLVYLIAQRTKMVKPNARNQCARVFAFKQSPDDAKELAEDFHSGIVNCAKVEKDNFIVADVFMSEQYKLNYETYPPVPIKTD